MDISVFRGEARETWRALHSQIHEDLEEKGKTDYRSTFNIRGTTHADMNALFTDDPNENMMVSSGYGTDNGY